MILFINKKTMLVGYSDENNQVREAGYTSPLPVTSSYFGRMATKTITYDAATSGAAGAHTLFTVTGNVYVKVFAVCTDDLTVGGATTSEVGVAGNTAALIAQTTTSAIDAGEIWFSNTPAVGTTAVSNITERLIVNGADIIETIGTSTITGGTLIYYCLWNPLDSTSSVVAA